MYGIYLTGDLRILDGFNGDDGRTNVFRIGLPLMNIGCLLLSYW